MPEDFAHAAASYLQAALRGTDRTGSVAVGTTAYQVVAVPVSPPEGNAGALIFGIRITDAALERVRPPSSEILVIAGGAVVASTLRDAIQNTAVLRQLDGAERGDGMIVLASQRFKPVTGPLNSGETRQVCSMCC